MKANTRPEADRTALETLITSVLRSGGAEISNFQPFIERLCDALRLPKPDFAGEDWVGNDYCFERRVDHTFDDGRVTTRRIDLYRRGCFIMEAKQSAKRQKPDPKQIEMLGEEAARQSKGHARRGSAKWDRVMQAARNQAIDYARDLPVEHGYPPFILTIDVGNVIEVFADFSGQGKNYSHFPDRRSFRIGLEDLRDERIQDLFWKIWHDPHALDPAKIAAAVTKDIAQRLAKIAKTLEKQHAPDAVADFLMRCLFTMFAEDVELIPKKSFENLLGELKERPETFAPALEGLWADMDKGAAFNPLLREPIRKFNGALFQNAHALPLEKEEIHELHVAAIRDWTDVEPAIFGTLLEQALDPHERAKLGAHFTPRAYVERLVIPTIIEPLRDDWEDVQARAAELEDAGEHEKALNVITDFHHQLCTTRVLDPACGTGNFLYVAFELMKKLEGEVLEVLAAYSGSQDKLALEGETVSPKQFYGLEINARAVPIAELVLWIGYLKWQLKTTGADAISEPVLHAYGNIRHQDAILAYDKKELRRDETGKPVTIWDGRTMKKHPVTGALVPDEDARIETYTYENPRKAAWPEAEFIVGNPPFIGGKFLRAELGDGYIGAVLKTLRNVPGGADFVMHFWEQAACLLARRPTAKAPNPLRRFGFITTNSITQTFSRRVVEKWMAAKQPLSLIFAVPDHPWLKSPDKAAVRIAMTVAVRGQTEGVLAEVVKEDGLDTDAPVVSLARETGIISSYLRIGADLSSATSLYSNNFISNIGFQFGAPGLRVDSKRYGLAPAVIRRVISGTDILKIARQRFVLDANKIESEEQLKKHPALYQYMRENVFPDKEHNRSKWRADNYWKFDCPYKDFRDELDKRTSAIVTSITSKHRVFRLYPAEYSFDSTTVMFALENYYTFAILSSRWHVQWTLRSGGTLEDRPRYNKTKCFDPFPFPACVTDPDADNSRLDELGERLDAFRKARLEDWDWLTMTRLYNALERYREAMNGAEPLTDKERDIHERAQVTILGEIHDDIDRAVLDAYGWSDLAPALVGKPGGTTPSPHKSPEQEEAEEELLTRLVALNKERAAEEARGHVRWLRPDYQIPKLGHKVPGAGEAEQVEADLVIDQGPDKPSWPTDGLDQIRLVRDVLAAARSPVDADAVTRAFKQKYSKKRRDRVEDVLQNLAEMGLARKDKSGYIAAR